tara:strand:- start:3253 stop:4401 length:1149 start_codon:yes stop_codon:yes gene_type:complete
MNEIDKTYVDVEIFYNKLIQHNIDFFTGVPDSLLKDLCAYITDNTNKEQHIIASNEGNAIAIAAGYYLGTKKIPLVYLQNSGMGNIVNPLTSLINESVYNIPILIIIGWRGQCGKKDEPQHKLMGKQIESLLKSLMIEYDILADYNDGAIDNINNAVEYMKLTNKPYVLLVQNHSFNKYKLKQIDTPYYTFSREELLHFVMNNVSHKDNIISSTGMLSRELYEYRINNNQSTKDILNVGSMGHCSSIGLGLSLTNKNKNIIVLDGDGSVLMHMGSIAVNGCCAGKNFKHIIFNNGAHDSVGGQNTEGFNVDFLMIAKACNYNIITCEDHNNQIKINESIKNMLQTDGPVLLELRCKKGARNDLGRPENFKNIKEVFYNEWIN